MRSIDFIVLHTAAHASGGIAVDTHAAEIDAWHKTRGFTGFGYHYLIRFDGKVVMGRPIEQVGAHVANLNARSIGICFSGHGDIQALTPHQWMAGQKLVRELLQKFDLDHTRVIGHREVDNLKLPGVSANGKTCPGKLVDMDQFREDIIFSAETEIREKVAVPAQPLVVFSETEATGYAGRLQQHLNDMLRIKLVCDGYPGTKTSDAFKQAYGHYLAGDPRAVSQPKSAEE